MAALEFSLKILDPEEMQPGDRPMEFGLAIIGTSKAQRDLAVTLLQRAAVKIQEDTVKKFGTGEVLPEPDEDGPLDRGIADVEAGRVAPLDLDAVEAATEDGD